VEALFPVPYRLLLFRPNPETGGNVVITDFIDDILPPTGWREYTRYGGRYSSSSNSYVFHFTRYLQGLIDTYNKTGSNDFIGFYLLTPSDFPITPARVMINNSPGVGPKVSVLYSKLN
jgi:hypothetical protein